MNTTYLIIVAAIVIVILVVALLVLLGLMRKKSKEISFTKEEAPKELTQQEKSGNYQASGGFNFAPAKAPEPEPELLQGQNLQQPPQIPDVPLEQVSSEEVPASGKLSEQDPPHEDADHATDIVDTNTPESGDNTPEPGDKSVPDAEVKEASAEPERDIIDVEVEEDIDETRGAPVGGFDSEGPLDPATVDEILAGTPLGKDADESLFDRDSEETLGFEPKPQFTHIEVEEEPETTAETAAETAVEPRKAVTEDIPESEENLDFPETPLFASVAEENPVDESAIREAEDAAEAARTQADAASAALEETPVPAEESKADTPQPTAPVEEITPAVGRLGKLRGRLSRSQNVIGQGVLGILSAGDLDEDAWEEIEDTLLMADLGTTVTLQVVEGLREKIASRGVSNEAQARAMLRETLIEACKPDLDRSIKAMPNGGKPAVVLVVGVNGTGKTTTTGKLARVLVSMGHTVLLGAADTFRAAAADQLETWGRRVGAATVRGAEGADPASVAFDAVARGVEDHVDVVLIDTAGRLHTSVGLMDQLGKVKRVVEKKAEVDEVLLVLDATVGQNGLMQARTFRDVVDITGVVLTKLDGTAKGGIVFQVQEELGVPVKLVGLGEGADDLAPFEAESFVDALLG
ncbi:signal recognition particle-docking protein FtsY [Corynebacterium freiburgense]|uniref:signal recognition particle-docking protein FtsY n=1 Tax=Corynebacterium freiburgense TaxID=556548 RepID=UPI00047BA1A2|nr:signal recognition particle-docking protein FtsY [Corynebacterium freiburgense]